MELKILPSSFFIHIPKKRERSFFLQLLLIILLLQQAILSLPLNSFFSAVVTYTDEGCALILLFVFCWKSLNGFSLIPLEKKIVLFYFVMIGIGLISNLLSGLQPFPYVAQDAFVCSKFLFSYLGIRALYDGKISESFLKDNFNGIAKIYSMIVFFLMLHEYLFHPFFRVYDVRYSVNSLQLFYPHPTYLACCCVAVISILVANLGQKPSNIIYIFMTSAVTLMTLRTKAIVFVILFWGFLTYTFVLKLHSKFLKFLLYSLLFLGALYLAWDQIQFYFFTSNLYARPLMLKNSFVLANRYFPLGSGFATYGSYIASVHYSPLYFDFGYNGIYGMSIDNYSDLSDGFWPIIIGQFGYIGLFCFLMIIVYFLILIFKLQKENCYSFLGLLSLMGYLLISSTSESAFFNSFSPLFFILIGIIVNQNIIQLKQRHCRKFSFKASQIKDG